MKSKIVSIIFSLLIVTSIYINLTLADSESPTVNVPSRGYAHLREDYVIPVTLKNETGEKIWKCWVEIDTDKVPDCIEIIKEKAETINFEKDTEITLEVAIRFKDNAPSGEYVIPLKVLGYKTACQKEGEYCQPLRPQNEKTRVILIIEKPLIMIDLKNEYSIRGGEKLEIPFSIENAGTGTAFNISVTYLSDYELFENLKYPETPEDLNASAVFNGKIYLDTENIEYGDYLLNISVEYFDLRNKKMNFQKKCDIHILGPSEEEINQEKLNKAAAAEREAESLLSKGEFDSALEKYNEAKTLYEEVGIITKVNDINGKINLIDGTIQRIQDNTEKADQEFQNGVQDMNNGDYSGALKKMENAKALYTISLNLTKNNESYKNLYDSKISDCEEKIQYLKEKINENKNNVKVPELKTVFIAAIVLLLVALILGIVLIRKE